MSKSAVCQRKVCSGAAEFESIAVKFFGGNYTSNVGSRVERSIQAPPSSSYPAPACCCLMFAIIPTLLLTHTNTHTRTHTHTRARTPNNLTKDMWGHCKQYEDNTCFVLVGKGYFLVVQTVFHFSSVKEKRKEGACAVVLAEHNHTLLEGGRGGGGVLYNVDSSHGFEAM